MVFPTGRCATRSEKEAAPPGRGVRRGSEEGGERKRCVDRFSHMDIRKSWAVSFTENTRVFVTQR